MTILNEHEVKFVDLRFTDTKGKEQHVTIQLTRLTLTSWKKAKCSTAPPMFDGSSIDGWKGINESDMVLMPDASTAVLDPFYEDTTLIIRCDILEPNTMQGYDRDPRSIAKLRSRPALHRKTRWRVPAFHRYRGYRSVWART
ncbi:MAG: glutamine synthetase beta-grasp domain-containing protein [Symbiopectobacterium sp.]